MTKDYTIAHCDEEPHYRYLLGVQTSNKTSNVAAVVQLNPSTANAFKSDPTIGKVSCWAAMSGFGRVIFLNLFAIRGADPASLIGKPYVNLVGTRNNSVCTAAFQQASTIIFAWGGIHRALLPHYRRRLTDLRAIIGSSTISGVGAATAAGFPRHGRMWNSGNRTLRTLLWSTL